MTEETYSKRIERQAREAVGRRYRVPPAPHSGHVVTFEEMDPPDRTHVLARCECGAKWVASGETAAEHLKSDGAIDPPEETVTIKAHQLRQGQHVKAEGAPARSTIRSLTDDGLTIKAYVDWGRIEYRRDEDVEIPAADVDVDGAGPEEVEDK